MKIEVEKGFYSAQKCQDNPTKLFIFGDNLQGVGKGGQAIIRDEPNVFGISTKYNPGESYDDARFLENKVYIDAEVALLHAVSEKYDTIVFPARGLGTGLAALQKLAPMTFIYLSTVLLTKFEFNNLAYLEPVN